MAHKVSLPFWSVSRLDQAEESEVASREAGGGGGLAKVTGDKILLLSTKDLFKLPLSVQLRVGYDLMRKLVNGSEISNDQCFESYILNRYGPTLYHSFFKGYTEKSSAYRRARCMRIGRRPGSTARSSTKRSRGTRSLSSHAVSSSPRL
jgi:hypothetical protein